MHKTDPFALQVTAAAEKARAAASEAELPKKPPRPAKAPLSAFSFNPASAQVPRPKFSLLQPTSGISFILSNPKFV
jgi:hypothetical protein